MQKWPYELLPLIPLLVYLLLYGEWKRLCYGEWLEQQETLGSFVLSVGRQRSDCTSQSELRSGDMVGNKIYMYSWLWVCYIIGMANNKQNTDCVRCYKENEENAVINKLLNERKELMK